MCFTAWFAIWDVVASVLLVATIGAVFDHVGVVDGFKWEKWPVPLAEWMIVGEWFKLHRWLIVGLWGGCGVPPVEGEDGCTPHWVQAT